MLTVNHSLSLSKAFNTSCMNTIRFLICALFSYFYYACLFLSGLVALMMIVFCGACTSLSL